MRNRLGFHVDGSVDVMLALGLSVYFVRNCRFVVPGLNRKMAAEIFGLKLCQQFSLVKFSKRCSYYFSAIIVDVDLILYSD